MIKYVIILAFILTQLYSQTLAPYTSFGNTTIYDDGKITTNVSTLDNDTINLIGALKAVSTVYGTTIVTNGDVEAATPTLPSGVGITNVRCTSASSTEQAHGGTKSVKVISDGTASNNFYTRYASGSGSVPGSTTFTYYISVWVYIPSGQSGFTSISLINKVGGSETVSQTTTLTDQWVLLAGSFTPNHTVGDFYAAIRTNSISNPTGYYFYWDDLNIQRIIPQINIGINQNVPTTATMGITNGLLANVVEYYNSREQLIATLPDSNGSVIATGKGTFEDSLRVGTSTPVKLNGDGTISSGAITSTGKHTTDSLTVSGKINFTGIATDSTTCASGQLYLNVSDGTIRRKF